MVSAKPFDQEYLRSILAKGRFEWRRHVLQRLAERGIAQEAVLEVLCSGECIEYYPSDVPYHSALYMGKVGNRPLHVVVALDENNEWAYIITAYEPNTEHFNQEYRRRESP